MATSRESIKEAIRQTGGNLRKAAGVLNLSYVSILARMRRDTNIKQELIDEGLVFCKPGRPQGSKSKHQTYDILAVKKEESSSALEEA